ncbi:MAG: hypothetical protein Q8922_03600 [Bacteroidota bacterium]|nr:hypothetical protein [Bacteroidota bacterium]MDP4233377.1 hypothetical protein [Bacteroidota bacterium]MDP4242243.1 hypothetical protein [Bacteroidota bacterium]MDP4286999.1 hypothetical protein [Bacteroidota bacterium]
MQAYHYHTTVTKEHGILLPRLPLEPGQAVSVTIEPTPKSKTKRNFPLRGLPFAYRDPFSPAVDPDDWNMLRDDPA